MAVYIGLMVMALSGYAFGANKSEKTRKHYVIVLFFAITLVAMLRSDQIGIDLSHYYNKYYPIFRDTSWNKLQTVTMSGDWELGFCAFCKLIGYISTDTQCFVIFTSIFTIVPYALFIYKNSDDVVFSTTFFLGYHVYMMSINVIRQAMAVGIILIGLEALKKKKYFRFILYVLFATLFHTSAVIALLLLLCDKLTFKKHTFYLLAIVTVIFSVGYKAVFERLLNISSLSDLYGIYSSTGAGDSGGYITFHTLGMFLIALLIFIYCYLVFKNEVRWVRPYEIGKSCERKVVISKNKIILKRISSSKKIYWSESMLMYTTYLAVLFRFSAFIINVTARFALYFIPFLMIAYPHACSKIQDKNTRFIFKVAVMVATLVFFLFI